LGTQDKNLLCFEGFLAFFHENIPRVYSNLVSDLGSQKAKQLFDLLFNISMDFSLLNFFMDMDINAGSELRGHFFLLKHPFSENFFSYFDSGLLDEYSSSYLFSIFDDLLPSNQSYFFPFEHLAQKKGLTGSRLFIHKFILQAFYDIIIRTPKLPHFEKVQLLESFNDVVLNLIEGQEQGLIGFYSSSFVNVMKVLFCQKTFLHRFFPKDVLSLSNYNQQKQTNVIVQKLLFEFLEVLLLEHSLKKSLAAVEDIIKQSIEFCMSILKENIVVTADNIVDFVDFDFNNKLFSIFNSYFLLPLGLPPVVVNTPNISYFNDFKAHETFKDVFLNMLVYEGLRRLKGDALTTLKANKLQQLASFNPSFFFKHIEKLVELFEYRKGEIEDIIIANQWTVIEKPLRSIISMIKSRFTLYCNVTDQYISQSDFPVTFEFSKGFFRNWNETLFGQFQLPLFALPVSYRSHYQKDFILFFYNVFRHLILKPHYLNNEKSPRLFEQHFSAIKAIIEDFRGEMVAKENEILEVIIAKQWIVIEKPLRSTIDFIKSRFTLYCNATDQYISQSDFPVTFDFFNSFFKTLTKEFFGLELPVSYRSHSQKDFFFTFLLY